MTDLTVPRDREFVRRGGLMAFVWLAWSHVFPGSPFVHNWHYEEVCKHLEAAYFGDFGKLLLNVPPGTGKSSISSVLALPWAWTRDPAYCTLNFSFDDGLCMRDARRCVQLVQTPWYRERWPDVRLTKADPRLDEIRTTMGGLRYSSSVGGRGTGNHGHLINVDDPIKPADTMGSALSTMTMIDYVNKTWWEGTMSTRILPGHPKRYVITMQRLAENDLAGHVADTDDPIALRLPMRFDAARACRTPLGGDRRTVDGELLFPGMFPESKVVELERSLGVFAHAQLQQHPTNPEGEMFKAEYLSRYNPEGMTFDELILSTDTTFKKTPGACACSIEVWGRQDKSFYLLDTITEQMSFSDAVRNIRVMVAKWPKLGAKLIEATANGPAIVDSLQKEISGFVDVTPEGGKFARANAVLYLFQAGNVFIPEDGYAPWVKGYVAELLAFPKGKRADQVDATTQALAYLAKNSSYLWAWLEKDAQKAEQAVETGILSPWAGM